MVNWKIFEDKCSNYLNDSYGNNNINFLPQGKSDSTISDILVRKNNLDLFYMEVKMAQSQSGQFVLLPEGDEFIFSTGNKTQVNQFTESILKFINDNINKFKDVNTKPIKIDLPKSYFSSWIVNYYLSKKVKFVITFKNDFVIFPIEKFSEYFEITANFRIKKSGSRPIPKKSISKISELVKPYVITQEKNRYFINTANPTQKRILLDDITIQFSSNGLNRSEIRQLGNTFNANVIFSIRCIKEQNIDDLNLFIESIS